MRRTRRVMTKCVGKVNISPFSFDVDAGRATYFALSIAAARRYVTVWFG